MVSGSFAFRLPNEIKAAAQAISLCRTGFYTRHGDARGGPAGEDDLLTSINSLSINSALIWFCRTGMPVVLEHVEQALAEASSKMAAWQGMVSFFIANPAATEARRANFDPESEAGKLLAFIEEDEENAPATIPRNEAATSFADEQERVMRLSAAKGALQIALSTVRP